MTGAEHYLRAEELIDGVAKHLDAAERLHGEESAERGFHMAMREAQVHATLALAAATALQAYYTSEDHGAVRDADDWQDVAGAR